MRLFLSLHLFKKQEAHSLKSFGDGLLSCGVFNAQIEIAVVFDFDVE